MLLTTSVQFVEITTITKFGTQQTCRTAGYFISWEFFLRVEKENLQQQKILRALIEKLIRRMMIFKGTNYGVFGVVNLILNEFLSNLEKW